LTKDRYPTRKHVEWLIGTKPNGRQAGEKDKELVKKAEWQIEQPVRCPSRRYAGPFITGATSCCFTAEDFLYMADAESFPASLD
jgi:hypothetical protein